MRRKFPVGAEVIPGGGVDFRVWAPVRDRVAVALEQEGGSALVTPLEPEADGYFSGTVAQAGPGSRYLFQLGDDERRYPDPASRFQPDGPHGPSEVVDPAAFVWTDAGWPGITAEGQVIYELHIGTFTREGTFAAAIAQLPALKDIGVTVIEVMPLADFAGQFGWGYDGVNMFAPTRLYGHPDDFRRFVDAAHGHGLGVILDVVYNHFGPDGNYLLAFAPAYHSTRHISEWGDTLNFDGEGAAGVREFAATNAAYWIAEFHLDGLRLDATQQVFDDSPRHILADVTDAARAAAAGRPVYIVAENEKQDVRLVAPTRGDGCGVDALWNDDFHHTAVAALTGHTEAYYFDYRGAPQEFVSAAKYGFLYQGQYYAWQRQRRGTPALALTPPQLITFLENHDQVANSARGARLHQLAAPGAYRALTALLLLGPQTPMLFQGQEFASSAPFLFFADHVGELRNKIGAGRGRFLAQFPSLASIETQTQLADPGVIETFHRCKLDHGERERHGEAVALHRDLLRIRRDDPVLGARPAARLDGAVLSERALLLRWFGADGERLLIVNLGADLRLVPAPEPLLAPPADARWCLTWSSEHPRYGGRGTADPEPHAAWRIPGYAALLFASALAQELPHG